MQYNSLGNKVLRLKNKELFDNPEKVLRTISKSLFKDIMPFNMELEKLLHREVDLILADGKIEEKFLKNITEVSFPLLNLYKV